MACMIFLDWNLLPPGANEFVLRLLSRGFNPELELFNLKNQDTDPLLGKTDTSRY